MKKYFKILLLSLCFLQEITAFADSEESMDAFFERFWFRGYHEIQQVANFPLFISDIEGASDEDKLASLGITHVVSVVGESVSFPQNIEVLHLAIEDNEDTRLDLYYQQLFSFIEEALERPNSKILFHCHAGMSRSASFLIASLMYHYSLSYDAAFSTVKKARKVIDPNAGFIGQLKELEIALKN